MLFEQGFAMSKLGKDTTVKDAKEESWKIREFSTFLGELAISLMSIGVVHATLTELCRFLTADCGKKFVEQGLLKLRLRGIKRK